MKKGLIRGADGDGAGSLPRTPKRKSVVPVWRRRQTVVLSLCLGVALIIGAGTWAAQSGLMADTVARAKWSVIKTSSDIGFTVEDVLVTGRSESGRAELLAALGIARGAPILAYDFQGAKARIESLPWVQYAWIERLLPSTLVVHLIERRPIALWQNQGAFALIDEEGQVITSEGLGRFSNLIQVVGKDAPNRVGGLLELLETQPQLKTRVRAAMRVGGRRWDLLLQGGVDVRLPEDGAPEALARLAAFERKSGVLERDVKVLDLRVPDRVIVRRQPGSVRKPVVKTDRQT